GLLATVFEDDLLELVDDGLLAGVSFGRGSSNGHGVVCCLRLLQIIQNLRHVPFGESVEHVADGTQDFDIFARNAVALEFSNDGFELVPDAFGGGLDLLLFAEVLLEKLACLPRIQVRGTNCKRAFGHKNADAQDQCEATVHGKGLRDYSGQPRMDTN